MERMLKFSCINTNKKEIKFKMQEKKVVFFFCTKLYKIKFNFEKV